MSSGKRYKESSALVERSRYYELNEAIELLKKSASAKFDETVELATRLAELELGVESRLDLVDRLRRMLNHNLPLEEK